MTDQIPQTYLPFHLKSFWEEFYKTKCNESINWYFDLSKVDIPEFPINSFSKEIDEILILGPGTSSFLDYLYENSYENVTLIDFSETLINILKEKYSNSNWDYYAEDILKVDQSLFSENYTVIIDKGCIDCLLSNPKNGEETFVLALNFISSCLDPENDSTFYYFSYGKPEERINLFYQVPGIKFKMAVIDCIKDDYKEFNQSDNIFYLYIITKAQN